VVFSYTVTHTAKCRMHLAPSSVCVGNMLYRIDEEVAAFLVSVRCYSMTLLHRAVLVKLTGSQLVQKFPALYETGRFITAFTSARHLFLYRARLIHSMPPHPTS